MLSTCVNSRGIRHIDCSTVTGEFGGKFKDKLIKREFWTIFVTIVKADVNFTQKFKNIQLIIIQKRDFNTINPSKVGMYVCGPTVYNKVHLGNCRTFISFDLIVRFLKHIGYDVMLEI